ncbi:DUF4349 domain-containing protein [Patulibacter sp. NPDC049589]|uniref:DUF4349 domain-containing protein n=1 Tax=Patulibacter sp. NPDC049589 TaxID=3154731 RepID=UPI00341A1762
MLRSEPRLDPDVVDELDRLDAALHAAASDDADPPLDDLDRELRALVADVRAGRPELDVGARMRIEERVQAAKAAPPRRTFGSRMPADRRWRAGLAAAVVVAVALPVGVAVRGGSSSGTGDSVTSAVALSADPGTQEGPASAAPSAGSGDSATSSGSSAGSAASSASASGLRRLSRESGTIDLQSRSGSATADSAAPSTTSIAPAPTKQAPLDAKRRVIRDVDQTVRVEPGQVARSAERVTTIVQDAGGYLASSQIRERGARAGGTFQVVVPTGRLDATVAALSRIGRPVRLQRSSTDVTDQAASLADQLADLRADRSAARLQLAKTVDPARRAARRRELNLLSSRVAALQGQVDQLRSQTATSRIDLRLTTTKAAEDEPVPVADDDSWGIGDAWGDAGRVLEVGGGVLLIGGVIVLPLAALGGLGLVIRRRAAARRREAVIDQA